MNDDENGPIPSAPAGPSDNDEDDVNTAQNGPSEITMFKEICGVDDATAMNLLRESGGNLEAAVHQFFYARENPEVLQNENNEGQELRRRHIDNVNAQQQGYVPAPNLPLTPQPLTWTQWIRGIVILPFRFFYSTAADLLLFFYNLFFGPSNRPRPPIGGRNYRAIRQQNVIEDRMLMREQQTAYEQALAIDRQKAQQRKREEEERRAEERRAREEEERIKSRKERLAERRKTLGESMEPEPGPGEDGVVRIRIAFPSGAKLERRFRQHDSLERLFEVVFTHPDCPHDFSLYTNYPSTLLRCAPEWYKNEFPGGNDEKDEKNEEGPVKSFAEAGLLKSAIIMIRDNEA